MKLDFWFLHNHVTLHSRTLILRFFRVVWRVLSDDNLKNNVPRLYKFSVLSRFRAILACSSHLQMQQNGSKAVNTVLNIVFFHQFIPESVINLLIDFQIEMLNWSNDATNLTLWAKMKMVLRRHVTYSVKNPSPEIKYLSYWHS